jgi:hypothetical protein
MAKLKRPKVSQLRKDELRLFNLFRQFVGRHGLERTRIMFANYATEPNQEQMNELERLETLRRLDAMPKPSVRQLARDILADEGIKPSDDRFMNKFEALVKTIGRWRNEKRGEIEGRFGSVSPPLKPDEPARLVIHKRKK